MPALHMKSTGRSIAGRRMVRAAYAPVPQRAGIPTQWHVSLNCLLQDRLGWLAQVGQDDFEPIPLVEIPMPASEPQPPARIGKA